MLQKIKAALGITSQVFDEEITDNMAAAIADMGLTCDITNLDETDPLIQKAVTTYCAYQHNMAHGSMDFADKFKESYDEQKSTLITSSAYTTWS